MIEFRSVTYAYPGPGALRPAIRDVSFSLAAGEMLCVLGANGSGKSTLARLCNGMLLPDTGEVLVDGLDTSDPACTWDVRARLGLVFQDPDSQIVGAVVEEDVAFGPENLGVGSGELRARVDEALAAVGLVGFERREPHLLSEGQKQRVAIAGALAMRPNYLVLDEPTASLDPSSRRAVLEAVEGLIAEGRGVIHVTHRLEDIAGADRTLVLVDGAVEYLGEPEGVLRDRSLMDRAGLQPPAVHRVAEELRLLGIAVPPGVSGADELLESLWP